jgi:hypothetical protein
VRTISTLVASLILSSVARSKPAAIQSIRSVDFRNYTYRLTLHDHAESVPLVAGHYRFPDDDVAPGVSLLSVQYGDLDLDGREEALVVLRYENAGSALHYDHLIVFKNSPAGPTVMYSRRYEAAASITILGSSVVVRAPFWLDDDAHCCPTYDARHTIKFSEGRLRVVTMRLYRRVESH